MRWKSPRQQAEERPSWRAVSRLTNVLRLFSAALALLVAHAASAQETIETNFSQYPGFETYLREHPPSDAMPDAADRVLLQRYRPRMFLAAGQDSPLDFYADYIAHGRLFGEDGELISASVDQDLLNRVKLLPRVTFVHERGERAHNPVMYGRIDRIRAPASLIVLTYHMVFRHSGLPAGLPDWQGGLLSIVADLDDWHQLDHYTAVSIVLDASEEPFAVMLQQHNYMRTHLIDESLSWPADDRVAIDVAIRSNELFPHTPGRTRHRAARFMTAESLDYLMGFGPPPFPSADDITEPANEVDYALAFLPPSDAFYVFRGYLGERRSLPGRSGPPGAFYNTLPHLKPLHLQIGAGYWRPGSSADRDRALRAQQHGDAWRAVFAMAQFDTLLANRACLRATASVCATD